MTRLNGRMIQEIRIGLLDTERRLQDTIGMGLQSLAFKAADLRPDSDVSKLTSSVVPVTSGQGVTPGFAHSVKEILEHVGIWAEVTSFTDVAGFAEAVNNGSDMIFMADDEQFVAHPLGTWTVVDNAECTALGFVQALEEAAEGLRNKQVLVIGLGRVGMRAIPHIRSRGASVLGLDIDPNTLLRARERYGIRCTLDSERAISEADLIFHASPSPVPGDLLRDGVIISAPGVPLAYDHKAREKAAVIIHDMLPTGVAVMAAKACKSILSGLAVREYEEWGLQING